MSLKELYAEAYRKQTEQIPPDRGLLQFFVSQMAKWGLTGPSVVLGGGRGEMATELGADVADWVSELDPAVCCDLGKPWPLSMALYKNFFDQHLLHCLIGQQRQQFWSNFQGKNGWLIGEAAIWDKRVYLPQGYERNSSGTIIHPNGTAVRTLLESQDLEQEMLLSFGEIQYFFVRADRRLSLGSEFDHLPSSWWPPLVQYALKLGPAQS